MKNQLYERIQAWKVKVTMRTLQHAHRVRESVHRTCRFFRLSHSLYHIWKRGFESKNLAGLRNPQAETSPHPLSHSARDRFSDPTDTREMSVRSGAPSLYFQRHYDAYIFFRRHHVGPIFMRKYRPRPPAGRRSLHSAGRSVQLDVKFVSRIGRALPLPPVHGHRQNLKRWEKEYNQDRPYLVLEGKTSAKRVCELGHPKSDILSL